MVIVDQRPVRRRQRIDRKFCCCGRKEHEQCERRARNLLLDKRQLLRWKVSCDRVVSEDQLKLAPHASDRQSVLIEKACISSLREKSPQSLPIQFPRSHKDNRPHDPMPRPNQCLQSDTRDVLDPLPLPRSDAKCPRGTHHVRLVAARTRRHFRRPDQRMLAQNSPRRPPGGLFRLSAHEPLRGASTQVSTPSSFP